jgi:hypothetical protein
MSIGIKFAKIMDFTGKTSAGAMLGGLGSNLVGQAASFGSSNTRDLVCAIGGFALFLWMLIHEKRFEQARTVSVKLDTPILLVEQH